MSKHGCGFWGPFALGNPAQPGVLSTLRVPWPARQLQKDRAHGGGVQLPPEVTGSPCVPQALVAPLGGERRLKTLPAKQLPCEMPKPAPAPGAPLAVTPSAAGAQPASWMCTGIWFKCSRRTPEPQWRPWGRAALLSSGVGTWIGRKRNSVLKRSSFTWDPHTTLQPPQEPSGSKTFRSRSFNFFSINFLAHFPDLALFSFSPSLVTDRVKRQKRKGRKSG